MNALTVVRILSITVAGVTYALALANLIVSFKVLRPRPWTWRTFTGSGGGFIWLHIVCVVIPFQGFVTWGIIEVEARIGSGFTWRIFLLPLLCLIINVGYIVIFRVELSRLRVARTGTTHFTRRATDPDPDDFR